MENSAQAVVNKCRDLFERGDFRALIRFCESAINGLNIDHRCWEWVAYANLCLGRYRAAEYALSEARKLNTSDPGLLISLGDIALRLGDANNAFSYYLKAQEAGRLSLEEQINFEYVSRGAGEFRIAARQTEWQLHRNIHNHRYYNRGLLLPRWQGEPLRGKSLLVHWADGFGDNIQHVRFLEELRADACHITLDCPMELYRLFVNSFPHIEIIHRDNELPRAYDYHTSILALAGFSGYGRDHVPAPPYLFPTESTKAASKDHRAKAKPNIGICWRASEYDKSRSFGVNCLRWLTRLGNLISLQKCQTEFEKCALVDYGVSNGAIEFADFLDTANCIAQLDYVLSVDTAVAHLAGAMGKPTILMLADPIAPVWACAEIAVRFYPSIHILMKPSNESWGEFIEKSVPSMAAIME